MHESWRVHRIGLHGDTGRRVGRLAGFELEPVDLRIRRIIFSPDGELGPQAMTRPLAAVTSVHDDGEVDLQPSK